MPERFRKIVPAFSKKPVFDQKTAEIIEGFVTKGKEVALEGKLTHGSYDDKEGIKRYYTEVVANEVLLLGNKN